MSKIIAAEAIATRIFEVRGRKVMLDRNLAELYGVKTKSLNLAIKRNIERFPCDFMFQLTKEEFDNLRFQFETSRWGGIRYLPYVFTEQGVAMLSSVLNSKRAIQVNILIMRAFTKLREIFLTLRDRILKLGSDVSEKVASEKAGRYCDYRKKSIFAEIYIQTRINRLQIFIKMGEKEIEDPKKWSIKKDFTWGDLNTRFEVDSSATSQRDTEILFAPAVINDCANPTTPSPL